MTSLVIVTAWLLAGPAPSLGEDPAVVPPPAPVVAVPSVSLVPPLASPAPAETGPRWYGWQTLIPDLALMAALVAELESHDHLPNRDVLPLGAYVFAVPTVHASHHRWAHFGLSLAARIVLPTILGLANSVKNQEPDERGAGWGIIGGMAAASFVDAVLSRD